MPQKTIQNQKTNSSIDLFSHLIRCSGNLYTWSYDNRLKLINSNCPDESLMNKIFISCGFYNCVVQQGETSGMPLMLSVPVGLIWFSVYEKRNEDLQRIYIIGPAFASGFSAKDFEKSLDLTYPPELSLIRKRKLIEKMKTLPILSPAILSQYAIMLHFCVTGEKLGLSDLSAQEGTGFQLQPNPIAGQRRRQAFVYEQELIKKIRNGDLNYKALIDQVPLGWMIDQTAGIDPLRQTKNKSIVFNALCARAVVEGGLLPEHAFALEAMYLQQIEEAGTITEIAAICGTLIANYARLMNRHRYSAPLSKPVRLCCDYIDLHIEEKIDLDTLAQCIGYSKYYLSRKFKSEIGCSINNYIKQVRIDYAKDLLLNTSIDIQELSDRLHFCSRSYFSDTFRQITGLTPSAFRRRTKDPGDYKWANKPTVNDLLSSAPIHQG